MKAMLVAAALLAAAPVGLAVVVVGPPAIVDQPSATALAEIPASLLPVYEGAATTCQGLRWQVLAAIGWVESHHANGRADPSTGEVRPPIFGPALDGQHGFAAIPDPAFPDGWAHAEGPMQFLPATWTEWATLAPGRPDDAIPDVQNEWDAIYSAAAELCAGQPAIGDLNAAILTYNDSPTYRDQVTATATTYGLGLESPVPSADAPTAAVAAALSVLGTPYLWGGESESGFDCSGLVQWSYANAGVSLPRGAQAQFDAGPAVPSGEQLKPGDLVFFGASPNEVSHVGIYIGGGAMVDAPQSGAVVRAEGYQWSDYLGATRPAQ